MRALVTGANGFVGRHLVKHLIEEGDEVTGTFIGDRPSTFECELTPLDINAPDNVYSVLKKVKPAVIYHLAGMAFVPDAEADFHAVLAVNVGGTANIFRQSHLLELGVTVLCVSSAEVYGKVSPADLPLRENSPIRPANNYGLSKRMGELVAERYDRQGSVKGIIARPFNHIGAGQDHRFVAPSFALQLARLAVQGGQNAIQVGNLDARRDFSDVRDIVRGYRLAVAKGKGIYNFGSGRSVSIRELLDSLIAECGRQVEVHLDPARMRPAEIPDLFGSIEKAKEELGWSPRFSLKETIAWVFADAVARIKP